MSGGAPSTRQEALDAIRAGDVVHGVSKSGTGKVLLVYDADETRILTRHVPSGARAEFGRDGGSTWCEGGGSCTIASTAPLPAARYEVVLGLDKKMRNAKALRDLRLTRAEIDLILTYDDYFKARPLPVD